MFICLYLVTCILCKSRGIRRNLDTSVDERVSLKESVQETAFDSKHMSEASQEPPGRIVKPYEAQVLLDAS